MAHTAISMAFLRKGLDKLVVNQAKINKDLDENWIVVAEAIQTILRREGYDSPYEKLKELTRGGILITQETIVNFIDSLLITDEIKEELKQITPYNYIGIF